MYKTLIFTKNIFVYLIFNKYICVYFIFNKNIFVYFHIISSKLCILLICVYFFCIYIWFLTRKQDTRQANMTAPHYQFRKESAYHFHSHAVTHVPEILSGRNCAVLLQIYFTTLDTWLNKNKSILLSMNKWGKTQCFFLSFANYAFWLGLRYVVCTFAT